MTRIKPMDEAAFARLKIKPVALDGALALRDGKAVVLGPGEDPLDGDAVVRAAHTVTTAPGESQEDVVSRWMDRIRGHVDGEVTGQAWGQFGPPIVNSDGSVTLHLGGIITTATSTHLAGTDASGSIAVTIGYEEGENLQSLRSATDDETFDEALLGDATLPETPEEEEALLVSTDNGPRDEDGDQPVHVPAHGVTVDADGVGVQTDDTAGDYPDDDLLDAAINGPEAEATTKEDAS